MAERSKYLSYPYVVSTLALIVACSGGAYAAGLAKNSVTTKQLAPGAVQSSDIKKDAVTGAAVKESTLATVPSASSASTLNGRLPASFVGSERLMAGKALQANGIEDLVFQWPEAGWKIVGDGTSATTGMGIRVVATHEVRIYQVGADVGAETADTGLSYLPTFPEFYVVDTLDPARYTLVSCSGGANIPAYTWCTGIRSK